MSEGPERVNVAEEKMNLSPEALLSPESIRMVMGKVQDIDKPGLAYSGIRDKEAIGKILHDGFLGVDNEKTEGLQLGEKERKEVNRESWGRAARTRRTIVHFNIVGREAGWRRKEKREIYGGSIGASYYSLPGKIWIVFNPLKFEEVEVDASNRSEYHTPDKSYKFHQNSYVLARDHEKNTEVGQIVDDEYGFLLSSRVAPRFFQGIVFCAERKYEHDSDILKSLRSTLWGSPLNDQMRLHVQKEIYSYEKQIDEDKAKIQVDELVQIQMKADSMKPQLLNPIYDTEGNLWWPKRMSHEEVKKFVAERDNETSAWGSEAAVI